VQLPRIIAIVSFVLATLLGCGQPLRIVTDNRVAIPGPVQANVIAQVSPATDDGPVVPMCVAGSADCGCGTVALVDVDGFIVNTNVSGPYSDGENPVGSFVEKLDAVACNPNVAAVVVRINSPGGGVAASQMMRAELESFRQRTGLPVVACLMDVGAGGAYYLATASDVIYAQPSTITGGIGVIFNAYNLQDMMAQFNILGQPVKAGENIDLGTPIEKLSPESKQILQQIADEFHTQFRDDVLATRPVPQPVDPTTFDGRIFTGNQALDRGLVDRVGTLDDAVEAARVLANRPGAGVVMYQRKGRPAYSIYATTPHVPLQATISLINVPGLERSRLPAFLYMWQPEPTMEKLSGE
jgi:protease-4